MSYGNSRKNKKAEANPDPIDLIREANGKTIAAEQIVWFIHTDGVPTRCKVIANEGDFSVVISLRTTKSYIKDNRDLYTVPPCKVGQVVYTFAPAAWKLLLHTFDCGGQRDYTVLENNPWNLQAKTVVQEILPQMVRVQSVHTGTVYEVPHQAISFVPTLF
ncbi:MAG: hypothetical protein KJ077_10775 [Anaerolineae bacterium]|nr:hypothetical protein [Anaerolineae bacterium]